MQDDVSANELLGKRVVTPDGRQVGTLDEVRVSPSEWQVTGLVIGLDERAAEDLRLKAPFMGKAELEVSPRRVRGVEDFVTLNVTLPELSDLVQSSQAEARTAR